MTIEGQFRRVDKHGRTIRGTEKRRLLEPGQSFVLNSGRLGIGRSQGTVDDQGSVTVRRSYLGATVTQTHIGDAVGEFSGTVRGPGPGKEHYKVALSYVWRPGEPFQSPQRYTTITYDTGLSYSNTDSQ